MFSLFSRRPIICHGTKFSVPKRHAFWDGLYQSAHFRFYLVGNTNKSWISKNSAQSASFAAALIRIVSVGGQVKLLSDPREAVQAATHKFIRDFMRRELEELPDHQRLEREAQLERNFTYAVADSHYRAVVSDYRLVLIPSLNTSPFKDEAPVFELSQRSRSPEFHTYMSDIERMFEQEAKVVTIAWSKP